VAAANKADEDKLSGVLEEIRTEDPTLQVEYNQELSQIILHGQGDLHLLVTRWRLEHLYKLKVNFSPAGIPYRETIRRGATAVYRHKKQSGGAGQFAEVHLKIEPYREGMAPVTEYNVRDTQTQALPWGGTLVFNNCIVGGAIEARFLPSIMKGILEKLSEGPLTGSYIRDVRVSVYDGKMHPVDSNDIAFKIAGMMAFRDAFFQADPLLLEPVYEISVSTPAPLVGDVMSELQSHRGMILGMETRGTRQMIRATMPQAELDTLIAAVRNISQGKARIDMHFANYAPMPDELQRKLVEAYARRPNGDS
jgi:elongation factor G